MILNPAIIGSQNPIFDLIPPGPTPGKVLKTSFSGYSYTKQ